MKKRLAGIEILRLEAMLMIVIYHVILWGNLDHDGWLTGFTGLGGLGVNIFGMITGYVSYSDADRLFKPQRYVRTWLAVLFYSVGITFVWKLISPEDVDLKTLILSFFPVSSATWWYFSSWTAVFFLQPVLLTLTKNLQLKRQYVYGYIVLFSVYVTIVGLFKDPFGIGWGFSSFWLCILYVIGAMLKKYQVEVKIPPKTIRWWLVAGLICMLVGPPLVVKLSVRVLGQPTTYKLLTDYTSPLVIFCATMMMLTAVRIDLQKKTRGIMTRLGPATFGIYIIHCHPYVKYIMRRYGVMLQGRMVLVRLAMALSIAVLIFVACLLCELMRIRIFNLIMLKNGEKKEKGDVS